MATLGELLFYVATQQQDSGAATVADASEAWGITQDTIAAVVRLLRPNEDEVCQHYAIKTIENICSQGGEWAGKFAQQVRTGCSAGWGEEYDGVNVFVKSCHRPGDHSGLGPSTLNPTPTSVHKPLGYGSDCQARVSCPGRCKQTGMQQQGPSQRGWLCTPDTPTAIHARHFALFTCTMWRWA